MNYYVTVTSQGQITIPAKLRKKLLIDNSQLIVREEANTIILEPAPDILSQFGVLHDKALTGDIDTIMKHEEEILTDSVAEKYTASPTLKKIQSSNK